MSFQRMTSSAQFYNLKTTAPGTLLAEGVLLRRQLSEKTGKDGKPLSNYVIKQNASGEEVFLPAAGHLVSTFAKKGINNGDTIRVIFMADTPKGYLFDVWKDVPDAADTAATGI